MDTDRLIKTLVADNAHRERPVGYMLMLAMLGTGQLDPRPYLSKVSSLEEWKPSFDGMHRGDLIKAVLTP